MDRKFDIGDRMAMPENAEEARKIIKALRGPGGTRITTVTLSSGRQVSVDKAPDEAVLEFAKEVVKALNKAASH